jgi:hypothetical protein
MAGAGKKTFVAGEVLLAQDVNDYLMDQSIMNFASDAARGSAIPTPTEGMLALSKDIDEIDYYNGSAWVPALPIGAWTAWTPTWSGLTVGAGTTSAAYSVQGKTVHGRIKFTFAADSSVTGTLSFALPFASVVSGQAIARGTFTDTGTTEFVIHGSQGGLAGSILLYAIASGFTYAFASNVTTGVPFTAGSTDVLSVNFTYERV